MSEIPANPVEVKPKMRQHQIRVERLKTNHAFNLTLNEAIMLFGLSGGEQNRLAHGNELAFRISLKRTDG